MRPFLKVLISFSIMLPFSCTKELEERKNNEFIGEWETTYYQLSDFGETYTYTTKAELKESGEYHVLEFAKDGTFYFWEFEGTWQKSGNIIVCNYFIGEFDGYGEDEYVMEDNILTFRESWDEDDFNLAGHIIIRYEKK